MKRTEAQTRVDALLARIGQLTVRRQRLEDLAEAEIERVKAQFGEIRELEGLIGQCDKELMGLLKAGGGKIYQGRDKVILDYGIIYHATEKRVTIPKGALKLIKELGWNEAVRVTEAVKREVVEGWEDDRLDKIGAKRKPFNKFSYEIKGQK